MKKTLLGVMILLTFGIIQTNAQTISGGIKAEANLSNFLHNDKAPGKTNMKFGASVGGFAKFDVVENFAIQPELLFHYYSAERKTNGVARNYEYWGMEIPVYAMGQWYTPSNNRFYAGFGPYVGLGFQSKYYEPMVKLYETNAHNQLDFGFRALVGYEFSNRIQLNAGYKIGVVNANDKDPGRLYSQGVSLGLGYRF
ncbi:MAG: PorT family protein [Rikenellaceae bacterium]|nr:PorT family protein [Rikenellaceae bacterium]